MNASAASYFARSSFETASAELMPPAARLPANRPIVATNQRAKTIQRRRALQSATRTVHGTPAAGAGMPGGGPSCGSDSAATGSVAGDGTRVEEAGGVSS